MGFHQDIVSSQKFTAVPCSSQKKLLCISSWSNAPSHLTSFMADWQCGRALCLLLERWAGLIATWRKQDSLQGLRRHNTGAACHCIFQARTGALSDHRRYRDTDIWFEVSMIDASILKAKRGYCFIVNPPVHVGNETSRWKGQFLC